MPRTTSSPPTAGLGWGWCSPEPGTDTAPHGIGSAGQQHPRGHRPGCSPKSNGAFTVGHRGCARRAQGTARSAGLPQGCHRGSTKPMHNGPAVRAAPTPAWLLPCLGSCHRACCGAALGTSPRSHCCVPANRLAGVMTQRLVHAAGNLLLRALPEGSHTGPRRWQQWQPTPQEKALTPADPQELAGPGPGAASSPAQPPLLSQTGPQRLPCCTALLAALSSVLPDPPPHRVGQRREKATGSTRGRHTRGLLAAGMISHARHHPGVAFEPPRALAAPFSPPQHQDHDPAAAARGGERWEALPPAAVGSPACTPVATWGCSHVSVEVL